MLDKKIKPLANKVLIKRTLAETSKGGILLPDAAQEKPKIGEIVAVGPGKMDDKGNLIKLSVNVGDKVLFASFVGTEVKSEGDDLLIMSEDDIFAIIS